MSYYVDIPLVRLALGQWVGQEGLDEAEVARSPMQLHDDTRRVL